MPVTDEHVAALRAHLALRPDDFRVRHEQVIQSGDVAGYGALIHGAFVSAVRRRFAPMWTVPDVIRCVVSVRVSLHEADIDIDPRVSEVLIRRALGEGLDADLDAEAVGRAQFFLLSELISTENLDETGLDEFLADARSLAGHLGV
jgi:hypothetical protein